MANISEITLTNSIKAPVEKVWWALTTVEGGEAWGAGPVEFNAHEGGSFSYWSGDIHGVNTKIVPMQLLEQDWYGHDHPEEKYRAVFNFRQDGDITTVRLDYSGNIYDEHRDVADWKEYYFKPIIQAVETS